MKIYLLLAHPDSDSFNGKIAQAYYESALSKGHEVRFQKLGEMKFDPILWKGYKVIQELEPDLKQAQEHILWCEKWVIVYPIWWGSLPALLKGFLDRTLYSGFAYKYHQNDPLWDKLLKGRSAELITTCDAPRWWIWWQYRDSDLNAIKRATLEFCGFSPVKTRRISRVRYLNQSEKEKIIEKIVKDIKP
ncbi:MAG: NAD(P)H-dependent oxidoreductase [Thermoflexibacter sp.]|jgi:putative NADPH-quinone reductase|nr:NAD(P)H-dependent oxidoreductase [Thermoflexibacter sp.]